MVRMVPDTGNFWTSKGPKFTIEDANPLDAKSIDYAVAHMKYLAADYYNKLAADYYNKQRNDALVIYTCLFRWNGMEWNAIDRMQWNGTEICIVFGLVTKTIEDKML
uniref:Uncharacterized protein n=1 Tax=Romanomermis culicivorax TaxID=13658 RepID=A0A915JFH4_ROMCU